jgi:hypothetical protein
MSWQDTPTQMQQIEQLVPLLGQETIVRKELECLLSKIYEQKPYPFNQNRVVWIVSDLLRSGTIKQIQQVIQAIERAIDQIKIHVVKVPRENLVFIKEEKAPGWDNYDISNPVSSDDDRRYGDHSYVWVNGNHRILLQNHAWKNARRAVPGWSIGEVLNGRYINGRCVTPGVHHNVWRFFREFCDKFNYIKQINLNCLTRPGNIQPQNGIIDCHTAGYAVDVGGILFNNSSLNFDYDRKDPTTNTYHISVPEPNASSYSELLEWMWRSSEYIEQYIDPWHINYGNTWSVNGLNSGTEEDHRHHLHLTISRRRVMSASRSLPTGLILRRS